MDVEALGNWMVRREVLSREGLRRARQRQSIYGGTLDTAVLELGLGDEAAVAACLAEATGLPAPKPEWMQDAHTEVRALLELASARRMGAQPVARLEDRIELVTRHGAPQRDLGDWASRLDLGVRCYIVPEVRFEALLALVHGHPVPPRFASLLGRIVGRARARRLAEPHAPAAREVGRPLVETGPVPRRPKPHPEPEADLDITEDVSGLLPQPALPTASAPSVPRPIASSTPPAPTTPTPAPPAPSPSPAANGSPLPASAQPLPADPPRQEAQALLEAWTAGVAEPARKRELARALRRQLSDPEVDQALRRWRTAAVERRSDAVTAIESLGELRDREAVPLLIDQLGDDNADLGKAAQAALVAISRHDFGNAKWRWSRWWREWKSRHRIEWLIDALDEKNAELRLQAAQELEELSGRYFGYHFDLGRREREEARRRWFDWWQSTGKATLG